MINKFGAGPKKRSCLELGFAYLNRNQQTVYCKRNLKHFFPKNNAKRIGALKMAALNRGALNRVMTVNVCGLRLALQLALKRMNTTD